MSAEDIAFIESFSLDRKNDNPPLACASVMEVLGIPRQSRAGTRSKSTISSFVDFMQEDFYRMDTETWPVSAPTSPRNQGREDQPDALGQILSKGEANKLSLNEPLNTGEIKVLGQVSGYRFDFARGRSAERRVPDLAAESQRLLALRSFDFYRTRYLAPSDPSLMRHIISAASNVAAIQMYALYRKLTAGKILSLEELRMTVLCCDFIRQRQPGFPLVDEIATLATARLKVSRESLDVQNQLGLLGTQFLLFLSDRTAGIDFDYRPSHKKSVKSDLLEILSLRNPSRALRHLERLFSRCLDPQTGLIALPGASPKPAPKRFYFSALIPLVVAVVLYENGASLRSEFPTYLRPACPESPDIEDWVAFCASLVKPPSLAQAFSPEPPDEFLYRADNVIADGLERDSLEAFGIVVQPLVLADGYRFTVSVRQDVDRPLTREDIGFLEQQVQETGTPMSLYFRPETFDLDSVIRLLRIGCEVGVHISRWDEAHQQLRKRLEDLVGRSIGGTYHGGLGSEYWRGFHSLKSDAEAGLVYSELLHEWFPNPIKMTAGSLSMMVTPLSVKVDARPEWTGSHLQIVQRNGGHAILEFHPDLFDHTKTSVLQSCLDDGGASRSVGGHVEFCERLTSVTIQKRFSGNHLFLTAPEWLPGMRIRYRADLLRPDFDCHPTNFGHEGQYSPLNIQEVEIYSPRAQFTFIDS